MTPEEETYANLHQAPEAVAVEPMPARIVGVGLLARQLSLLAQTLPGQRAPSWRSRLTPRQAEVGVLVADGRTNEEIAQTLSIQLDTVKKYVSQILSTTGARNRVELARLVIAG